MIADWPSLRTFALSHPLKGTRRAQDRPGGAIIVLDKQRQYPLRLSVRKSGLPAQTQHHRLGRGHRGGQAYISQIVLQALPHRKVLQRFIEITISCGAVGAGKAALGFNARVTQRNGIGQHGTHCTQSGVNLTLGRTQNRAHELHTQGLHVRVGQLFKLLQAFGSLRGRANFAHGFGVVEPVRKGQWLRIP